jgi:hypothetical protein
MRRRDVNQIHLSVGAELRGVGVATYREVGAERRPQLVARFGDCYDPVTRKGGDGWQEERGRPA